MNKVERKVNEERLALIESLTKKLVASEYKEENAKYFVGTHHIVVKVPVTVIEKSVYIDTLSYEEYFYVEDEKDVPEHWIATSVEKIYKASATKTFIERPSGKSIKCVSVTTLATAKRRYLARH